MRATSARSCRCLRFGSPVSPPGLALFRGAPAFTGFLHQISYSHDLSSVHPVVPALSLVPCGEPVRNDRRKKERRTRQRARYFPFENNYSEFWESRARPMDRPLPKSIFPSAGLARAKEAKTKRGTSNGRPSLTLNGEHERTRQWCRAVYERYSFLEIRRFAE